MQCLTGLPSPPNVTLIDRRKPKPGLIATPPFQSRLTSDDVASTCRMHPTSLDVAQTAATLLEFSSARSILLTVGGTATMKFNYVIEFVTDMDRAVKFYRDALGLPLKFQSPGWSEFSTG